MIPLLIISKLSRFLDSELVSISVSKDCVNCKLVFKVHSKCLILKWKIHIHFFFYWFCQLVNELFKNLRLSFFNTLSNLYQLLYEFNFLDYDVMGLKFLNAKIIEGRIARQWLFNSRQKLRFKTKASNIFILVDQCNSSEVLYFCRKLF